MARDIAEIGRQEIEAHRRFSIGVTATDPRIDVADAAGNKEWVVDVFLGAVFDETQTENVVIGVPIVPSARLHVTEQNQPVLLERSKQGKYTVVGRSKTLPAGYQIGDILEDTYHRILHNYADLGLLFIPDLDFTLEELQADPDDQLQADPADPLQTVSSFDAFGHQVGGPGVTNPKQSIQDLLNHAPKKTTTARHLLVKQATLGDPGDPDAMVWGTSELQPTIREIVTTVT